MLKTNLNALFETDRSSEENGVWVDVDENTKVRIRSYAAKAVADLRENLMKPYAVLQRTGAKIPDAAQEEIGLRVLSGAVIADWSGLKGEGEDGQEVEIPYSPETAYDLMKAMPRFANFVIGVSSDAQFYKDTLREDGAKN